MIRGTVLDFTAKKDCLRVDRLSCLCDRLNGLHLLMRMVYSSVTLGNGFHESRMISGHGTVNPNGVNNTPSRRDLHELFS